ncbi:MAG: radical SAM protein [Planctomycetia bacterium]|nr:radical SAM protein [Planctomycetia bacterium]
MHPDDTARPLFEAHPRAFEANRYVYPVLSRRARGISIGVNLNRDKTCNFHCVYCQVDRTEQPEAESIDLARLDMELDAAVAMVTSGRLFDGVKFAKTPRPLRRLNDIALSGDGEPTAHPDFFEAVRVCAEVRRRHALNDVKLVLITNASLFHVERVRRGLEILDANGGEIWAKLDAGTEAYYTQVARSAVPFHRILDNLVEAARARPLVIQSLFMRIDGHPPADAELDAYGDRLSEILAAGGRIKEVQIHTVARRPAETWVAPLADDEVDAIGQRVRARTGLPVSTFYGEFRR